MATDPFHAVQHEVQTSLQTAETLRSSFRRIRSTAREDSEELGWARNELKATLAALDADLEDLEESVRIVVETGPRMFGLDDAEVTKRQQYVSRVRKEVQEIRVEVDSGPGQSRAAAQSASRRDSPPPDGDDEQAQWALEEQTMIIQQQDQTIDTISGTLNTLAQQAGLIGQEVSEHHEMLADLEDGVDRTAGRLDSAMKKMQKFIRQQEETKSGWCIAILIVVLIGLLLAVILV